MSVCYYFLNLLRYIRTSDSSLLFGCHNYYSKQFYIEITDNSLSTLYLKKNDNDVAHYNFNAH